jgi:hypothetical protein
MKSERRRQRIFLKANEAESIARADKIGALRKRSAKLPDVSRILVSIKDLFNAKAK